MLIPSIVSIVLISLFVFIVRLRKARRFSDKSSWNIVDSTSEEWPKRPANMPKEKNRRGIYIDRIPVIADTAVSHDGNIYSFSRIAGNPIKSLPLHTTEHSNEEHYLTTVHLSFHRETDQVYMDILSLDKDFPLSSSHFSLLFANSTQWDFTFPQKRGEEYAQSIPLHPERLQYLVENPLDKWRLRRDKDDCFTVGALNFETRKYIYKPEIQDTIQTMARKMWDCGR
ncbi:MAG: hypothetical protein QM610_08530 [Chitinophagaceae bacterium]